MRSSVTCTIRFCVTDMILVVCVLDYIMHNDDMQVLRSLAHLVHNPRRDPVHLVHNTRRDRMSNRMRMYSRDRSRRT